jgi:hypothetical protein
LDILLSSQASTNRPEGFEVSHSVWHKSPSTISWKAKGNAPCRAVSVVGRSSLFYRLITSNFRHVVCLDGFFIVDGGDWKHTIWQGVVHIE